MAEKPVVSVVIPAHNAALTIQQTIDSVLKQDVPLEIIVVDDASTDTTLNVLSDYGDHINVITNTKNLGVAQSRNRGIQVAKGVYIAFCDADDWWEEGKLSHQLQFMKQHNASMCTTARELVDEHGQSLNRIIHVPTHITYHSLLKSNVINCSSVLVLKDIISEYPMEHSHLHEDYLTWLRLLKDGHKVVGLNEPYLKYRITSKSKSGNKLKSAWMHYRVYHILGIHPVKSFVYFVHYALEGLKKYRGL